MSTSLIILSVIAFALLILVISSKVLNILIGFIGTIAGIGTFIWFGMSDSATAQLEISSELGINPNDLKTYLVIVTAVFAILFILGIFRGKKKNKDVVKKAASVTTKTEPKVEEAKVEEKIEEAKVEEIKKEEKPIEPKVEDVKKDEEVKEPEVKEVKKVEKVKEPKTKEVKKEVKSKEPKTKTVKEAKVEEAKKEEKTKKPRTKSVKKEEPKK